MVNLVDQNLHPLSLNLPIPQLLPPRPQQVFPRLLIGELLFVRQNS
jgi:hypothetical protein